MQKLSVNVKERTKGHSAHPLLYKSVLNRDQSLSGPDGLKDDKLTDNSLDAVLTSEKTDKASPKVFVINHNNNPLMPTNPRNARVLLKEEKATVIKRTPFTIRLTYQTGGARQPISLGVDSGFTHVGLSAVSDKEELFSADVSLRSDMVKLNSERKIYRRNRRNKLWYFKPSFIL